MGLSNKNTKRTRGNENEIPEFEWKQGNSQERYAGWKQSKANGNVFERKKLL